MHAISAAFILKEVPYEIGEQVQVNCTIRCTRTTTGEFDCIIQLCTYDGPKCFSWG